MATVGDAWVNIRASGDSLRADIKAAMESAAADAESSGSKAGDAFGDAFGDAVNSSVRDALQGAGSDAFADIVTRAAGTADSVNSSFGSVDSSNIVDQSNKGGNALQELSLAALGLGEMLDGLGGPGGGGGGNLFQGLTESALVAEGGIRDLEVGIQAAGNAVNSAGGGGGGGVFLDWVTNGAKEARQWLDQLVTTGNFLGAGLFQLVGAVGALVASLFSIGSAVGAAVPSLIALGGVFASLIQGLVAFGIAWQGVSNAISQGLKTQTKAGQQAGRGARSQVSNARAIEAAQRALRDAYQRSAESASAAARQVSDAEADLANAQRKSEQAQSALTAAREAGVESLQQLGFSAEEAALAEEGAAISLEKALGRLRAVQSLPPDSRTRREAELAFKEAELSYREAKDRNSDLAAEQEKAAQAGVDGTKEVTDAKNDIVDADNKVIESQQKLNDAIVEQQKAAAKSAQDIADAIRQLELAQQAAGSAAGAASGALNNYQTALSDLGPSQAEFVRFIVSLGPLFRTLKTAIGDGLFPPLTSALQELFKNTDSTSFFGMLKSSLTETGAIVGKFLASLVNLMNDPFFKGLFFDIIKNNNEVLKILTGAFTDIAAALLVVFDAAGPVTKRFAEWFGTLAKGWRDSATAPGALGKLTDFFNKAGDAAGKVFNVFGDFFDMVMALAETALPAGTSLLEAMSLAFQGLTGEIKGNKGGLTTFFNAAASNATAVMDVLGDFGRVLFSFADNPGIKQTALAFKPLAPVIQQIGDAMIKAGPAFARVAVAVANLILQFVNSGQLERFFNTFSHIIEFVTAILKTGFGKALIGILGVLAAVLIPIRVLGRLAKKVFIGEVGYYISKVKWALEKLGFLKPTEKLEDSMKSLAIETNKTLKSIEELIKATSSIKPIDIKPADFNPTAQRDSSKVPGAGNFEPTESGLLVPKEKKPLGFNPIDEPGTPNRVRVRRAVEDAKRGGTIGAKVGSVFPGVGTAVGAATGAGGALITRGVGATAKSAKALGKRVKNKVQAGASRLAGRVRGSGSGKEATSLLGKGADAVRRGKEVIEGFGQGMKAKLPWVKKVAKDASNEIINEFDDPFNFGSPSKTMKQRGIWIVEGLGIGIKSEASKAISAASGVASDIDKQFDTVAKKNRKFNLGGMFAGAKEKIGGAVGKIGGVAGAVKGKIGGAVGKIGGVAGAVKGKIGGAVQAVKGSKVGKAVGAVKGKIGGMGGLAKGGALAGLGIAIAIFKNPKIIDDFIGKIVGFASKLPAVITTVAAKIPVLLQTLVKAIGPIIGTLVKAFPGIINSIATELPKLIGTIAKALPGVIGTIAKALPVVIGAIAKLIPQVITALAGAIPLVISALAGAIPALVTGLATAIPAVLDALVGAIPVIITAITNALPTILEAILGALPMIINAIFTALPQIVVALANALPLIIGMLVKAIPMLLDAIIKAVPLIINGLITALPLILRALVGILPAILTQVVTIFKGSEGLGKIVDWFSKLPGMIADFLWKGDDSLLGKIKELPGKITDATKNMFSGIYNGWATVINGMIEFWNKLELKVGGWEGSFFGKKVTFPTVTLGTPDIPWRVPTLAKGGVVSPVNGGTMALLGEAGRSERVTPLDANGFTPAERAILQALSDNAEKEVNIQVFVGNQQIKDIVDVKMNGKSIRDARRTNYSRPVN